LPERRNINREKENTMTDPRTTFDMSTSRDSGPDPSYSARSLVDEPGPELDTLELLRQAVSEQTAPISTIVDAPGGRIRLICSADITSKDIQRWNRKALPPVARRSNNASGLDVDQGILHTAVLVNTTERIEVRNVATDEWKVIEDIDGNVLTFKDTDLLRVFGAMDAEGALRKLFTGDAYLVKAGTRVLTGAGWAEGSTGLEEDEDADPTR
jgi:hypothetical protein